MQHRSNYDLQVDMAREIFRQYDARALAQKFGLKADDAYAYLTYLGAELRICLQRGQIDERQEGVWQECRNFSTVMTVYDLLCHHKGDRLPLPSGKWQPIGSFVMGGVQDTGRFTKDCAACFQKNFASLPAACEALGGMVQPSLAGADLTCLFPVTDFFSLMLQFWLEDEDFPPKITLLWDSTALQLLHFETTFYLQQDLLDRLRSRL
ncbi:MAG: DUF3786 domain-containing protein [Oscillospiraceae bacterium]|nr:DUF3786 domain-containing protein [Oscillospiraceae bacterium]